MMPAIKIIFIID